MHVYTVGVDYSAHGFAPIDAWPVFKETAVVQLLLRGEKPYNPC